MIELSEKEQHYLRVLIKSLQELATQFVLETTRDREQHYQLIRRTLEAEMEWKIEEEKQLWLDSHIALVKEYVKKIDQSGGGAGRTM